MADVHEEARIALHGTSTAEWRAGLADAVERAARNVDDHTAGMLCDAADALRAADEEIARLKARIEEYRDACTTRDEGIAALNDQVARERTETARLRAEAERLRGVIESRHGGEPLALLSELDEARAEIARLRGDLQRALATCDRFQADHELIALLYGDGGRHTEAGRAVGAAAEAAPPQAANRLDPLLELATREVEEIKALNGDALGAGAQLRRGDRVMNTETETDRDESPALAKFERCHALAESVRNEVRALNLVDAWAVEQLSDILCEEMDGPFSLLSESDA